MGGPRRTLGLLVSAKLPALVRIAAAFACAACACAQAADERRPGLQYGVGVTVLADDNLFRLPDGITPADAGLAGTARSDTIVSPFVDIDALFLLGRQTVHAGIRYNANRFERHGEYDGSTLDYSLDWQWALAHGWDGTLAVDEKQQATSLDEYRGLTRNILTTQALHAAANYRPRPDRRATLGVDRYLGSNSVEARNASDFEITTAGFELGASSALAHEIRLGVSRTEGRYPNRQIVGPAPVDNSYAQNDVHLGAVFAASDTTRLDARFGHAWRRYDEVPERNFDGPTWQFGFFWQMTAKLSLQGALSQQLGAVDDFDRIYVATRAERVTLRYQVSAKVAATAGIVRTHLRYRGDPNNVLTQLLGSALTPDREDDLRQITAGLQWQPTDRLSADFAWTESTRDSNRAGSQSVAAQRQVTVQYRW